MSVISRHCGVDWNGRFRCGRPSCDRCRRRQILRETRAAVKRLDAPRCQFVPITIFLGSYDDAQGVIAKFRSDLRNRVNLCRASRRWADVVIWGWFAVAGAGSGLLEVAAYAIARIERLLGRADVHDAMARTWDKPGYRFEVGASVCKDVLPMMARGMVETAFGHGSRFDGLSDFRGLRFRYGRTHKPTARKTVVYEPMPILF